LIFPGEVNMNLDVPALPVTLNDIGQIAVTVTDLARAKAFYQDVLGMQFLFDAGPMSFFQCGKIRFAIGTSDQPASSGGTILYFRVADILDTHHRLVLRGVEFIQKPQKVAQMPDHDLWLAFFKDQDGSPIGLMCEMPRAPAN
jgi:methylmalonyl-CoA/ethylmalonyl-CoA epimerase